MIGIRTIERARWVVAVVLAMAVDVSGQCLMPEPRPESPSPGDRFWAGVAIDGDVLVVGADQGQARPGEVHVFRWDGFKW